MLMWKWCENCLTTFKLIVYSYVRYGNKQIHFHSVSRKLPMPNVISFKIGTLFPWIRTHLLSVSFFLSFILVFCISHWFQWKDRSIHRHFCSLFFSFSLFPLTCCDHWHVISLNDFYLKRIILHQPWKWSQVAFIPFQHLVCSSFFFFIGFFFTTFRVCVFYMLSLLFVIYFSHLFILHW